jgi:hypothetical protein
MAISGILEGVKELNRLFLDFHFKVLQFGDVCKVAPVGEL